MRKWTLVTDASEYPAEKYEFMEAEGKLYASPRPYRRTPVKTVKPQKVSATPRQCGAKLKRGGRCQAKAKGSSIYCGRHQRGGR